MDDSQKNKNKPLKNTVNLKKGIMDTYKKNDNSRNIPISDVSSSETEFDSEPKADMSELSNDVTVQLDEYKSAFDTLNGQLNTLENEKSSLSKERDDYKEQLMRKVAELENFRRRSLKEKEDLINYANERLLQKMLVLIDDLNNALESAKKTTDINAVIQGVEMIYQNTLKIFEESGVKAMENPEGSEFDVHLHEALMAQPSDLPEGYVVKEFQKGYLIHDRVLRHARVVTSSGNQ